MKVKVFKQFNIYISALFTIIDIGLFYFIVIYLRGFQNAIFYIILSLLSILFCYSTIRFIIKVFTGCYTHLFIINQYGVEYIIRKESFKLKWEDISYIHIIPNKYGRMNKSSFICFNSGAIEIEREISGVKDFNNTFFGVQYRDIIVEQIRKYTDMPIQGIYQVLGKDI